MMFSKKGQALACSFFLLLLLTACASSPKQQVSKDTWQPLCLTEDKKYEIMYSHEYLKKEGSEIKALLRFYPDKETRDKIRAEFEEQNKKAMEITGQDPPQGWERLIETAIEQKTIYYIYRANCNDKRLYVDNGINFIIEVKEGMSSEAIYNLLCSRMS